MKTIPRRLVLTTLTAMLGLAAACGESSVTAPASPTIGKPRASGYTVPAGRPTSSTKGP